MACCNHHNVQVTAGEHDSSEHTMKDSALQLLPHCAYNMAICLTLYHCIWLQSCKLSVFEHRVMDTAHKAKDLPAQLAEKGKVSASSRRVAQLIGQVSLNVTYSDAHT